MEYCAGIVTCERPIEYEDLEKALIRGGRGLNWEMKSEDLFRRSFRGMLESYAGTQIQLKLWDFPTLRINLDKRQPVTHLQIETGTEEGLASDSEIKRYFGAVSKILESKYPLQQE